MIPSSHVRAAFCLSCREVKRHEKRGQSFLCECGRARGPIESPKRMTTPVRFTKYLEGRYWDRIEQTPYCWIWTGEYHMNGKTPQIYSAKKRVQGKHLAWYFSTGSWPKPDLWILRTCFNVRCLNPEHLAEGDRKDWGRLKSRAMRLNPPKPKTHCQRGHRMVGENIIKNGDKRCCHLCRLITNRRHDAKQKILAAAKRLAAKGWSMTDLTFSQGQKPERIETRMAASLHPRPNASQGGTGEAITEPPVGSGPHPAPSSDYLGGR